MSRNLAIKVRELHAPNDDDLRTIQNLIVSFSCGLKDHLREEASLRDLPGFEAEKATPGHVPSYIVRKKYSVFYRWTQDGRLSDQQLWVLDTEARCLLDVCGACERIKTTPTSISWRVFTRQCIFVYLLVFPWGLVDDFGAWTIPITVLVAYFVIAGESIAHFVEMPFGPHEDHLDLDAICLAIDRSVSEVLTA